MIRCWRRGFLKRTTQKTNLLSDLVERGALPLDIAPLPSQGQKTVDHVETICSVWRCVRMHIGREGAQGSVDRLPTPASFLLPTCVVRGPVPGHKCCQELLQHLCVFCKAHLHKKVHNMLLDFYPRLCLLLLLCSSRLSCQNQRHQQFNTKRLIFLCMGWPKKTTTAKFPLMPAGAELTG